MDDRPLRGSCLCGRVRFEVAGKPLSLSYCHCSRCLKVGGVANVGVAAAHFRFVAGADRVVRYEPEPPFHLVRAFCGDCGSYLGEPESSDRFFPIAASAFDDDPRVRPVLHEQVASKAPWYEIGDDLPQYPADPPLEAFRAAPPDGPAQDEVGSESPDALMRDYERATAAHDLERTLALIDEHAVYWFSTGAAHVGREAVAEALRSNFAAIEAESYTIDELHWRARDTRVAVCTYRYRWSGRIRGEAASGEGRGTSVLRRTRGRWRVAHEHLSSGSPGGAP